MSIGRSERRIEWDILTFLPVYSFLSLSHSSKTKVSPSFTSKSARRNSSFFLPETILSKYSRQTFLLIVAISYFNSYSQPGFHAFVLRQSSAHQPKHQAHGRAFLKRQ